MKAKRIKIINLIVAVLIALFAIGQAFAWFVDGKVALWQGFGGSSAGAYFAYGDGSEEQPFGIDNKYHMYNLAWLQNTGRLDKKYYFELGKDLDAPLDMDDMWLPPIGNDDYPFIGVFNGKGKEISNLKVTTDKSLLAEKYAVPASADYAFSNAVGMFGMTTKDSEVSNFVLTNPVVEAANTNTNYATEWDGTETDTNSKRVIGLAVGHVAGKCYSIGVRANETGAQKTSLLIDKTGYSTFNSILGELGEGVTSSVTGGGHTMGSGGSGNAFGASFDVDTLATRLTAIKNNKGESPFFPQIDTKNDIPVPQLGYKVPFAVDKTKSEYTGSDAKEIISDQNIGYVMGNQNKISAKKINYTDNLMKDDGTGTYYLTDEAGNKSTPDNNHIPRWFYVRDNLWGNGGYVARDGFAPISQDKYDSLPDNVKKILMEENHSVMRIQAGYTQYTTAMVNSNKYDALTWGYHGQVSWMGKTYGEGFNRDGYIAGENGDWLDISGNYMDNDNNIYYFDKNNEKRYIPSINEPEIQIQEDGRLKYSWAEWYFKDAEGNDFNVYGNYTYKNGKIVDEKDNEVFIFDPWNKKYATVPMIGTKIDSYSYTKGVALPNNGLWFKPSQAGVFRFVMFAQQSNEAFCLLKCTRTNATVSDPFYTDGSDIEVQKVMQQQLPPYVLFYFEYEVKEEEIYNTEYIIMVDNNVPTEEDSDKTVSYKGAYFLYLDIGSSAAEDTSGVDRDKSVSAVDFIYDGVDIYQGPSETISVATGLNIGDFIVPKSSVESDGVTHAGYESSKTSVYFEKLTVVLEIVFVRLYGNGTGGKTIALTVTPDSTEVTATNTNLIQR